jgi:TonB family protein
LSVLFRILGSNAAKGYLTSLLAHGGAFALCLAASGWMNVPVSLPHYGSRAQQAIELSLSLPAPFSVDAEPPEIEVVISPGEARMGDRHFVLAPATQDVAAITADSRSGGTLSPVLPRRETAAMREETALSPAQPPRPASRRAAAAMPSVVEVPLPAAPMRFVGRVPRYPAEALSRGLNWEGTVVLLVYIDAAGRVVRVEIETSSGFAAADAEAIRTVRTWRAVAQIPGDRLTARVVRQPVQFKLRDEAQ